VGPTHGLDRREVPREALRRARRTHAAIGIALACSVACGGSALPGPELATPAPLKHGEAIEVPFPPPPARVEFIPKKPRSGAVWIDGEWSWTGRRWAWTYGRWLVPPPDATFAQWRTARMSDGALLFAAGTWYDARGQEITEPVPLAIGAARQEDVVTPPGHTEKTAPNQFPSKTQEPKP
jgi:hypothetical protein